MTRIVTSIISGILVLLFSTGCSTTHLVKADEELVIEKQATLVKNDSKTIDAYNIFALDDSLVAIDLNTNRQLYFHQNEIDHILVTNRLRGALQGLVFGGLGSAGIAFIIASQVGEADGWAPLFALVFGGIGGLIGPIPGSIIGHRDLYIFEHDSVEVKFDASTGEIIYPSSDLEFDPVTGEPMKQETLSQKSQKRMPHKPIKLKHGPANQLAGGLFMFYGEEKESSVIAGHYRRFIDLPKYVDLPPNVDEMPGAPYRYYLNLSFRGESGIIGNNGEYGYREGRLLTLGMEGFRLDRVKKGRAGFVELGWIKVSTERDDYWETSSEQYKVNHGLCSVVGVRGWSNMLFGEIQVSYDTWSNHLVPNVVAGYRF